VNYNSASTSAGILDKAV